MAPVGEVRSEVASSVKTLSAEAAKPKAEPKPATKEAASAAKQPTKADKPKPPAQAGQKTEILPAATPSPSMVGASAAPTPASGPGNFSSAAASSHMPGGSAPRQGAMQMTGAASGG